MIKFGIGEYVKNIGYNIVSILLLAVTFLACTIFSSNISAQNKINRFLEPYLNENSIITCYLGYGFDAAKLDLIKYEKSLMTKEVFCDSNDLQEVKHCLVYNEYVMDNLTPRLVAGELIDDSNASDGIMQVLISENYSGVGVGDIIEITFYTIEGAMEGRTITVPAKVTGIIASGQRLFFGNGVTISQNMETRDIYGTYSFQQLGYALIITTEQEFNKLPEEVDELSWRNIIKFHDDITPEERQSNYRKIMEYEKEHGVGGTGAFPETSTLVERQQQATKDLILTNIPLCIAVFVLVSICIICMISIRNANSMRYYATLYICGMPYKNAVLLSGIEMLVNNVLAIIIAITFVTIQKQKAILETVIGEINCELGFLQICIILAICLIMVIWTMLITRKTLRERSPMNVLRDTAY